MEHREPKYKMLEVELLVPTPDNPRAIHPTSEGFLQLQASVKAEGVKIPVVARPHPEQRGKYDLRAGARRLLAAKQAGLKTIPALIYELMTDTDAFDMTYIENFGRDDLTPMEESQAVAIMLEKYGGDLQVVADKFGKSPRWVKMRSHVHDHLSKKWAAAVLDEKSVFSMYTLSHLELIARFDPDTQDGFMEELEDWGWSIDEQVPTLKGLEKFCGEQVRFLKAAPWDLEVIFRDEKDKEIWSCASCTKRSSRQPLLWEADEKAAGKKDRCLDAACWQIKQRLFVQTDIQAQKAKHPGLVPVILQGGYREHKVAKQVIPETRDLTYSSDKAAKAGEKGAVPCYVVTGPKVGQVVWRKGAASGADSVAGRGPRKGLPKAKDMKIKRKELASKRWNQVLKNLQVKIGSTGSETLPDGEIAGLQKKTRTLLTLIRHFGTHTNYQIMSTDWEDFSKEFSRKLSGKTQTDLIEAVWKLVRPELISTFSYCGPITQVPESKIESAKAAAELLGIDLEAMFAEAEKAIPEPKSWATQEAKAKTDPKKKAGKKKTTKKGRRGSADSKKKKGKK